MDVLVTHANGKVYRMPAQQVVCYNTAGQPLDVVYESGGLLVQSDAQDDDFGHTLSLMRIGKLESLDD